jgi:hypothetical protein
MARATKKIPIDPKAAPLPEGKDETPLDYMLRVMRDPTCDAKRRDAMALKAASLMYGAKTEKPEKEPLKVAVRKFGGTENAE